LRKEKNPGVEKNFVRKKRTLEIAVFEMMGTAE
jgi:hypothetical protein